MDPVTINSITCNSITANRSTGATTATVTVNAAFLQEIKEVNEQLWRLLADIRRICCRPAPRREHGRLMTEMLGSLRDQLAMHFSLEEYFGYFENPVDVAPRLSLRAEQLRCEHTTLFQQLCAIVDEAEAFQCRCSDNRISERVAVRFRAFCDQLKSHESHENDLILEAFDVDLGVGD